MDAQLHTEVPTGRTTETLVAIVAEECAKVCDDLAARSRAGRDRWVAFVCAEAIRAKFPLPKS